MGEFFHVFAMTAGFGLAALLIIVLGFGALQLFYTWESWRETLNNDRLVMKAYKERDILRDRLNRGWVRCPNCHHAAKWEEKP